MTSLAPSASACPACVAAPAAERIAEARAVKDAGLVLSLPTAHCAVCISDVERTLSALPGVRSARLNLTLKRVSVAAAPEVTAEDLIGALKGIGYPAHELDPGLLSVTETDKAGRDLLMRLGVAGFAMMNIMLLSVAVWSGAEAATRDLFHWISAAIALPTLAFSGQPFFASAFASLKARRLGMDVPISLALILASSISLYETFAGGHNAYFDAAVSLCFFLLAGRYLDYRSRAAARSAAEELTALEVPRATRVRDGAETVVPIAELAVGDLVRVRPGGRMPVDGVVTEGTSEIDRSLLTGETLPVWAGEGSAVSAGEVNLTGPLTLRVTAAGRDTSLHRMADLVAVAESARTRYTSLADRMARAYSPVVHLMALASFSTWLYLTGDLRLAVNVAAAVLIITCPCALALAVPAVVTSASGKLFRKGFLIKDGTALERLAEVDTVVFDKTGTLTLGAPEPVDLAAYPRADLEIAAALAGASAHPLSRAISTALAEAGVVPARVADIREVPGYGVEGRHGDRMVRLGRAEWVGATPADGTATYLSTGEGAARAFGFTDRPRPGAGAAVAALKAAGKRVILLSGDTEAPVARLASDLGIEDWQAGQRPEDKAARISALTGEGARVLMVGDGLNDTAALASAHVSISPASALDAARVASDIVLLGQDLAPLADAIRIAKQARIRIKQNFALSLAYNLVAVPVALVGLATPLIAALAMSTSSVTVSLNALRLK
ncbi:heavy metal translocating P-type ATPase [Defluviimonas sp. WL0024]|uniref:Heavy metal translocating P-type ATPase n=1 Tax=Albidovulum salinarum TaxID=2984153 RepID=A0ABT2X8D5_9RHOB|nr:heavy metal translocating P-type ATPase [Defluviimonas sp. WL0024]MCU9850211.1 heavy metal translocating P-type ATPase [Defluviimonas sp. WL0024]